MQPRGGGGEGGGEGIGMKIKSRGMYHDEGQVEPRCEHCADEQAAHHSGEQHLAGGGEGFGYCGEVFEDKAGTQASCAAG